MKLAHQTTPPAADANDVSNRDDPARNLRESGGTTLSMGAVADGEYLKRSGTSVISAAVSGTDANAIHKNVAAEISTVTEKAVPVAADLVIIEDSEDSNNKKRVQIGNFPGGAGGGGTAVVQHALAELSADQNYSLDAVLDFDTLLASDGITVSSSGVFTLEEGKTYVLIAGLQANSTNSNDYFYYQWYDYIAASYIGKRGASRPTLTSHQWSDQSVAIAVITAATSQTVALRFQAGQSSGPISATLLTSYAYIEQLVASSVGQTGETYVNTIRAGDVASHDSATPLVVSQFAFDPSEYSLTGATRSLVFRAVAANGGGVAQTKARLYSVTDTEYIGSGLTFTTAAPAKQQETLTIGSGAGEVDDSEKIYEVHIWVVSPDLVDDTIELGSAELRLVNTIN